MVVAPSIDAIAEVSIQKTSYAPEFGGKSGAEVNVISKSGTNQFHGSLQRSFCGPQGVRGSSTGQAGEVGEVSARPPLPAALSFRVNAVST
jgi:hypothetical protein